MMEREANGTAEAVPFPVVLLERTNMRSILEEETAADLKKNDLQHINVKLILERSADLGPGILDPIIPIFHGWIQNQVFRDQVFRNEDLPELLIDVADYRHVHHGPGILLIGHEADYSIDNTDGRLCLRYNRKIPLTGTNDEKLVHAAYSALAAAKRLQEDTRLNSKLNFNGHDIEIFINDRLIAPNNDETRRALDPELRHFANKLLNGAEYSLKYETDPRRLFSVTIHSEREFSIDDLLQNLAS
jgi:hypothetical protein